jgi:signal transduction histidine kinase
MITAALVNLLGNAFDAGGAEPPGVSSRLESQGGESAVVVEVGDRGAGIPEDRLEEVQRPFVTTKAHGTGLGLVIVQRTAALHRARFALERRPGGGTLASLRFPVRRAAAAASPGPTPAEATP